MSPCVRLVVDSIPTVAASQEWLSFNNVNNIKHKKLNIFNWTPAVQDVTDFEQESTYQLSDLDDMNTKNPLVIDFLTCGA
jgi:hypothetical protein